MAMKLVLLVLAACWLLSGCAWGRGPEGCPTSGFTSLNPDYYKLKEAFHVREQTISE